MGTRTVMEAIRTDNGVNKSVEQFHTSQIVNLFPVSGPTVLSYQGHFMHDQVAKSQVSLSLTLFIF